MDSRTGLSLALLMIVHSVAGCGGGSPAQTPLPVSNAISIASITPASAPPGSPNLTITINGTNFENSGMVRSQAVWSVNNQVTPLNTTIISSTQLTAIIPASLLNSRSTAQIEIENYDTAAGMIRATSNSLSFSVETPLPGSVSISSISPASAIAGSPDLTVTITGQNFATAGPKFFNQAVWSVNGTQTMLAAGNGQTQITAIIPAALLKNPVVAYMFVQIIDQDGTPLSISQSLSFTVTTTAAAARKFVTGGDMQVARYAHSATLLTDGKVLIAGGANQIGVLNSAELYDPATGTFTPTGSLITARQGHTATALADGKVLIVGGEDNVGPIGSAELYDPATGQFISAGSMNTSRWSHTATLLGNEKVLLAGGADNIDSQNSAELFDPATRSFTAVENMTTARMHHTATLLANGKVLLAGGWSSYAPITSLASTEVFDPAANTFVEGGSMSIPRNQHTATLLPDGRVAILGGKKGMFSLSSVEILDPASEIFGAAGELVAKRTDSTATLLPDGTVLIVAGVYRYSGPDAPEFTVLASAEVYSPASRSSQASGSLETPRYLHTATLLRDGRVLIVGGVDNGADALAAAELYE